MSRYDHTAGYYPRLVVRSMSLLTKIHENKLRGSKLALISQQYERRFLQTRTTLLAIINRWPNCTFTELCRPFVLINEGSRVSHR